MAAKSKTILEYGDFQTPLALARQVCGLLRQRGVAPSSVLEPTCGKGHFLVAAKETFENARTLFGLDINVTHVEAARSLLRDSNGGAETRVLQGDFFLADWDDILASMPEPLLIVGNLPWVTNATLGVVGSNNLPVKSNLNNRRGLDALTGKSNFDISEWMLIRMLDWIRTRDATLAILCKSAVARKVLAHAWRHSTSFAQAEMFIIDAAEHFGVSVDACLLVVAAQSSSADCRCDVYASLQSDSVSRSIGFRNGMLVANMTAFDQYSHLISGANNGWRSGIKHDCARVIELVEREGSLTNGLDESVDVEADCLYPMLKSSDVANGSTESPDRWMLVTQRAVNDDTETLADRCPKTWSYLIRHASLLDARASSIYKGRPRFSMFGVGDYSFAPWKVAISGLYKRLEFRSVGPYRDKPVVLDDTCYFYPCATRDKAEYVLELLNSTAAQEFFSAFVFWDAKRPINVEILRLLDLGALAKDLDLSRAEHHFRPVQGALRI